MKTDFLKILGSEIRKYRIKRDMTQETLAELVGIHPTYVGKIESGKNNPSIMMIYKISRALNVNLNKVFSFDE